MSDLHRNLELLRRITGLGKSEFSELLGVRNIYRNDIKYIGYRPLQAIKENFTGVDEGWLSTYHETLSDGIIFTPRKPLPGQSYCRPDDNSVINRAAEEMDQYQARAIMLTSKVMTSRHKEIGKALMKNLEEFAEAVSTKDELARCNVKLEEQDKKIREMDGEIKHLKKQVEELLKREPQCDSAAPGDTTPVTEEKAM
jgi:hypothetical protein